QQYCGKCGIDPDISSGVGKVVPWSTRLLGWVGGFLLRGVLTIGAELMRPLSSSTLSKDITFLGLGRDRHQPLTRVRTGIDDLATYPTLLRPQQCCGKRGIDPDRSFGVGQVVPWSTRLLGWLGGFPLRGVLTIGAELMRPLSSSTLSKDITF